MRGRLIAYVTVLLCATALAPSPSAATEQQTSALKVYLFASATCPGCADIKEGLFPQLKERFGARVDFQHLVLDEIENFNLLLRYEDHYGVDDDKALKIFVGSMYLSGKEAIFAGLETMVEVQLARGAITLSPDEFRAPDAEGTDAEDAPEETSSDGDLIRKRFEAFRPATVALAGLIDGVNPCAFATLVFFVSLLSALRKRRRDILVVGVCFSLSVFLTYLALGVGALKAIKIASVTSGVAAGLSLATGAFAFVLAACSFWDYAQLRRSGLAANITLKLPHAIRVRMNRVISKHMRTRNLVVGALSLGVIVSLLESLCTGQVYLPTLVFVMHDASLAPKAFAWIVMYNVMFIIPLLGVFGLAYLGVTSQRMLAFSKRHLGVSKLLLGLLFLGLGILLFATAL